MTAMRSCSSLKHRHFGMSKRCHSNDRHQRSHDPEQALTDTKMRNFTPDLYAEVVKNIGMGSSNQHSEPLGAGCLLY